MGILDRIPLFVAGCALKFFRIPGRETRFDPHCCVGYNPMTNQEVLKYYEELKEHYGDTLVNFEHYPKIFASQVKMYKYYKERNADIPKPSDE